MKNYEKVEVSETQLEDLVRRHPGKIEGGLVFVDHQKTAAGGRLDVLMIDSGKSLVVAELKVVQDDGMLVQGLDYYDYVSSHVETYARLYKHHLINPTQQVRLILVAPEFGQLLVTRCKWLDLPISLFTYTCLKFENEEDVVPVFHEREIPASPEVVAISSIEDHLSYITDPTVRSNVTSLLEEIKGWKPGHIALDPIKQYISMKVNNRVFAYLSTRRKHFVVGTYGIDGEYKERPVKSGDDLTEAKSTIKTEMERHAK
jgi:hypothetical protein